MTFRKTLALGALIVAAAAVGWAQDARFSQGLTPVEQSEAGLTKLSTDQLAVLDALVRHAAEMAVTPDTTHPPPARFTHRLSSDERRNAGLDLLTEAELAHLDALIGRHETGQSPSLQATPASITMTPERSGPSPEIHGMISFTHGVGQGGYREQGGAIVLSLDDPAHDFSLFVGYEEMRAKGPWLDRGCAGSYFLARPVGAVPSLVR